MFVNGIPFVFSVSRGVNFTMVEYVIQLLKTVLADCIGKIFKFYRNKGCTIKMFLMDREFECIRYLIPEEVNINTTVTNKRVSDIELKNSVVQECTRALIRNFPFKKIPGQIIIELNRFVVIWLNQEPPDNGILDV